MIVTRNPSQGLDRAGISRCGASRTAPHMPPHHQENEDRRNNSVETTQIASHENGPWSWQRNPPECHVVVVIGVGTLIDFFDE